MAKQLIQLIIAGGQVGVVVVRVVRVMVTMMTAPLQVVGRAFSQAVRQEIAASQEAAKARGNSKGQGTQQAAETLRSEEELSRKYLGPATFSVKV